MKKNKKNKKNINNTQKFLNLKEIMCPRCGSNNTYIIMDKYTSPYAPLKCKCRNCYWIWKIKNTSYARYSLKSVKKKEIELKKNPSQYTIMSSMPQNDFSYSESQKEWYHNPNIKWGKIDWRNLNTNQMHTVTLFSRFLSCAINKHQLKYYHAKVKDLKADKNTQYIACLIYCCECNRYYMDLTQYNQKFRRHEILPNFKIYYDESIFTGYNNFKLQSELSLYGYNARKTTPKSYRQHVLYDVISNNLMTKGEVVSHLQGLISLSEPRSNMRDVIKRYAEDIMFIHEKFPGQRIY